MQEPDSEARWTSKWMNFQTGQKGLPSAHCLFSALERDSSAHQTGLRGSKISSWTFLFHKDSSEKGQLISHVCRESGQLLPGTPGSCKATSWGSGGREASWTWAWDWGEGFFHQYYLLQLSPWEMSKVGALQIKSAKKGEHAWKLHDPTKDLSF